MEECACFVCFDCDLLGGDWSKTITFVSVCVLALDGKRKGYPNIAMRDAVASPFLPKRKKTDNGCGIKRKLKTRIKREVSYDSNGVPPVVICFDVSLKFGQGGELEGFVSLDLEMVCLLGPGNGLSFWT